MKITQKHLLYFFAYFLFDKLWQRYDFAFKSFGILRRDHTKRRHDFGECDEDGNIRVSIYKRDKKTYLTKDQLIDTIAHEAAHLTEWDHTRRFWKLKKKYEKYMKGL